MRTPAGGRGVAVQVALSIVLPLAGPSASAQPQDTLAGVAPDTSQNAPLSVLPDAVQDAPQGSPQATLDVMDLWRRIRHLPPVDPNDAQDYRKRMPVWAPIIGGKPTVGLMVGVAGNITFYRGEPQTTRVSSLNTSLTFSTSSQTSVSARLSLFGPADAWRLEGDNRAKWGSQDNYGLGANTQASEADNTKFTFFRVHETAYRRLAGGMFGGLGIHFDDYSDFSPGSGVAPDEFDETEFVTYSTEHGLSLSHQVSAGLSVSLLADTRDSTIDPRTGWLGTANYRALFKGVLGGSSGWQLVHVEGRTYRPLGPSGRQRLAVWLFGDFTFGGPVPYFDLPTTGMDPYGRSARGYAEGHFRGERLMYGEVEYRRTLTDNGLLGLVVFLNTSTVSNEEEREQLFEHLAPGGGAGLRVLLNKRSRVQLCFDVGFGERGSTGVYVAVQEAF